MNALRVLPILDFSQSGISQSGKAEAKQEESSIKVMKYLYPWWDMVGRGLHTSEYMQLSMCLACINITLLICSQVCLPSRQVLQGLEGGSRLEISIPVTRLLSAMHEMALV